MRLENLTIQEILCTQIPETELEKELFRHITELLEEIDDLETEIDDTSAIDMAEGALDNFAEEHEELIEAILALDGLEGDQLNMALDSTLKDLR